MSVAGRLSFWRQFIGWHRLRERVDRNGSKCFR
jgi:hypothetical protein